MAPNSAVSHEFELDSAKGFDKTTAIITQTNF